jgi:DNA-binding beta-propeller fold protein YncE
MEKPWQQRVRREYGGMVVDQFGSLYATVSHTIVKIGPDGKELGRWGSSGVGPGQFLTPLGIALDGQGNLYVADSINNRIQKLSANGGRPIAQFGTKGTGPGQFNNPTGVAIDQRGNIYVSDRGNHRIQKLSPTGEFLEQWGKTGKFGTELLPGVQPGQFHNPEGLALDSKGNLYVADQGNNRIQKLILNP